MQDHNLDDLIVDTIHPKNSKTKSFLTIIALAIIVLIIAIILTKIILKAPDDSLIIEENNTELISPELTLQAVTEKEKVKAPLIPTTEEVKPDLHVDTTEKKTSANIQNTETKIEAPSSQREPNVETVKISNDFAEAEETKENRLKAEKEAALQKEREVIKAKELAKKREAARLAEEKAKKAVDNEANSHAYFIQVGSFNKTPSERFLAVIKNSGFTYQITAPSSNGTKKLLVGPYSTKTQVDSALIKVKDRINKSAYIIRK